MNLVFSHGKESGPWGFKIKRLARLAEARGCEVDSIDYRDCPDPDERVERLLARLRELPGDIILVGSSMGGYVSLVASASVSVAGLFLMAPALCLPGYRHQDYRSQAAHIEIVHGWGDDIVPPQHSIDYARAAGCTLHLIPADHPLNSAIDTVESLFEQFLGHVLHSDNA